VWRRVSGRVGDVEKTGGRAGGRGLGGRGMRGLELKVGPSLDGCGERGGARIRSCANHGDWVGWGGNGWG